MGDEQNVAAFRRVMEEGFSRGDLDAVDQVVSAEYREHGEMLGIPATGRRVTWESIDIARFDHDGTLLEHWGLLDRFGVLEQLGAVKL